MSGAPTLSGGGSGLARPVERVLSPKDAMFEGHAEHYFRVGEEGLRWIRNGLALAGSGEPRALLDLPCGHGRVLRWMRAAWPSAELTACDLDRDGVEFCAATFGARGVPAELEPARIALAPGTFDVVWVGSLLTHLDLPLWRAYIELFRRSLKPGGLLAFTTLGRFAAYRIRQGETYRLAQRHLAGLLAGFEDLGFAYVDYPGCEAYGICLARPDWVVRGVQAGDGWRLLGYCERGWDEHQDVVLCQKL